VSSSVLSLPKHRYGRSSVSAAGVLSIIVGGLLLLFGTITLATSSTLPRGLHLAVAGLIILMGGVGIATGWGLLLRSRWAQILAIMCAIVLVSPNAPLPASVSGWVGELISVGIGIWWLMLFVGKAADEEFTSSDSPVIPGAVLAVSWLLIQALLSLPLGWILEAPTFFFGHHVSAPYSHILFTILCVLSFVLGIALLKRSRLAFWLAFGLQVFCFTNAVVTDFTPSALAEINRVVATELTRWQISGFGGIGRTFSFLGPMVLALCLILSWPRYAIASEPMDNTLP
jgi:hypothetical protein